jgi:hypothetical protein
VRARAAPQFTFVASYGAVKAIRKTRSISRLNVVVRKFKLLRLRLANFFSSQESSFVIVNLQFTNPPTCDVIISNSPKKNSLQGAVQTPQHARPGIHLMSGRYSTASRALGRELAQCSE